jgi:hypothetical protein
MSDELDFDEDLEDLLSQLDSELDTKMIEESLKDDQVETKPTPKKRSLITDSILDQLEDIREETEVTVRAIDVRSTVTNLDNTDPIEPSNAEQPKLEVDVQKYKDRLEAVTVEVLDACRADRAEAQEVIEDLKDRLAAMGNAAAPKALIDGLVKAVEVKANINSNAIRMMDTNAKFLASIKANNTVNNNNLNLSASAEELRKILG